ncbi:MAG: pantothenate kinase [Crocinitomicaceae bacterium]|jgi:pantothenate kinase
MKLLSITLFLLLFIGNSFSQQIDAASPKYTGDDFNIDLIAKNIWINQFNSNGIKNDTIRISFTYYLENPNAPRNQVGKPLELVFSSNEYIDSVELVNFGIELKKHEYVRAAFKEKSNTFLEAYEQFQCGPGYKFRIVFIIDE